MPRALTNHLRGGSEKIGPMGQPADYLPEGKAPEGRIDAGDIAVAIAEHVVTRDLDVVVQGETIDLFAGGSDGMIVARLPPAGDRLAADQGESRQVGRHRAPQHALLRNVPGRRRHRDGADVALRHHRVARLGTVDHQGVRPLLHHPQPPGHLGPGELAIGLHVDDHVCRDEVCGTRLPRGNARSFPSPPARPSRSDDETRESRLALTGP